MKKVTIETKRVELNWLSGTLTEDCYRILQGIMSNGCAGMSGQAVIELRIYSPEETKKLDESGNDAARCPNCQHSLKE